VTPSLRTRRISIIGGGATGVLVAIHLLRSVRACARAEVTLLEPRERLGDGLAYGTGDGVHLLNVPAGRMGAFPHHPGDFVDWLRDSGQEVEPGAFVPRALLGEYLRARLGDAAAKAPTGTRFVHLQQRAADVLRSAEGWRVLDATGVAHDADEVVLATGVACAAPPAAWNVAQLGNAYLGSPWSAPGLETIHGQEDLLLVGTGLTAVDAVLTLARRGHRGRVHAVSHHGWWPRVHAQLAPAVPAVQPGMSVRECLRALRAQVRGGDARASVDALRAITPALWDAWPVAERRRFLRHVRAAWDVHRHRMAPRGAQVLQRLQDEGRLTTVAGRVLALERTATGVRAAVAPRGGGAECGVEVQRVIGCLGVSPLEGENPLLEALLRRGTVAPDALGLGLQVRWDGAIAGAPGLHAVGPLRRGQLWESTALPEIRVQAASLAAALAAST